MDAAGVMGAAANELGDRPVPRHAVAARFIAIDVTTGPPYKIKDTVEA